MVVAGCGWKCLRVHGVPVIFTTAKKTQILHMDNGLIPHRILYVFVGRM